MPNPLFAEIEPLVAAAVELGRIGAEQEDLMQQHAALGDEATLHRGLLNSGQPNKVSAGSGAVFRLSGLTLADMDAHLWMNDSLREPPTDYIDFKVQSSPQWVSLDRQHWANIALPHPAVDEIGSGVYLFSGQWAAVSAHKLFLYARAKRWAGKRCLITELRAHAADPEAVELARRAT